MKKYCVHFSDFWESFNIPCYLVKDNTITYWWCCCVCLLHHKAEMSQSQPPIKNKSKTCIRSYQQETLCSLSIFNPPPLGRDKIITLAAVAIFVMLTTLQQFRPSPDKQHREKVEGVEVVLFSRNIFTPSIPAAAVEWFLPAEDRNRKLLFIH